MKIQPFLYEVGKESSALNGMGWNDSNALTGLRGQGTDSV